MNLRPPDPDPFAYLPRVPSFTVVSATVENGQPLPTAQLSGLFQAPGGQDVSPALSWSDFPAETESFVVTMYDPQAPTGSGFWHWVVMDIPPTTRSLQWTVPDGVLRTTDQKVGGSNPFGRARRLRRSAP
jgi:phosphatidylethanolamine-binding protein (PEBP) family uncharacterized protein